MAGIFGGADNDPAPKPAAPAAPSHVPEGVAGQRVACRTEVQGISEVPSSRVLAAPGGQSSMASLIAGMPEPVAVAKEPAVPAPAVTAAPAAPQLAAGQRVAVRTEHQGINEVSSSRVLAAPGGQSDMASLISGGAVTDRKAELMARRAAFGEATNVLGR